MKNIEMRIEEESILVIRVDLKKSCGRSKSGKSIIIATTEGNVEIPGHPSVKAGINIYK